MASFRPLTLDFSKVLHRHSLEIPPVWTVLLIMAGVLTFVARTRAHVRPAGPWTRTDLPVSLIQVMLQQHVVPAECQSMLTNVSTMEIP